MPQRKKNHGSGLCMSKANCSSLQDAVKRQFEQRYARAKMNMESFDSFYNSSVQAIPEAITKIATDIIVEARIRIEEIIFDTSFLDGVTRVYLDNDSYYVAKTRELTGRVTELEQKFEHLNNLYHEQKTVNEISSLPSVPKQTGGRKKVRGRTSRLRVL